MLKKKVLVSILTTVVLLALMIPTVFADPYIGWWGNSLSFSSSVTKGAYRLAGNRGGFLGHFSSSVSSGSFNCEMYYWVPMGRISEVTFRNITCSTGTSRERITDVVNGEDYGYVFTTSGQTIVSNDAGYFYDDY